MTEPVRAPSTTTEPDPEFLVVPPAGASETELLAALVAALVAGASVDFIARVLARFAGIGSVSLVHKIIDVLGWGSVLTLTAQEMAALPRTTDPSVLVLQQTALQNAFRRAAYFVNAARRMAPAVSSGDAAQLATALERERQFQRAHVDMERRRNEAGRQVAELAASDQVALNDKGELLMGWRSRRGPKTCPTCRAAHGRNFNALVRPRIGYPGEVHMWCECTPRKPWPTKLRVESSAVPEHTT